MQRFALLLAIILAAYASTCEQRISEAKFFINGEAQAKRCPRYVKQMMLSSFGVSHHRKSSAIFDIFNRPKANLLVIKDQTSNTDCAFNHKIKRMLNKFYGRFQKEQPFVVSIALDKAMAERPIALALNNDNVYTVYQDKSSLVSKDKVITQVQDSELATIIASLNNVFALKSQQGRTPDLYIVTLKQDQNVDSLFVEFNKLYEKTVGQEFTVLDSQVVSRRLLAVKATPGFNITNSAAFWLDKWVANNFTAPSNYTQMDADMADHQIQVWVWIGMIFGFFIAFFITGSISFYRDALEYSVTESGSDD